MAADTLAAPRLSLNVRYNRNSGEEEENQVEILEDEEHDADLGSQRARPHNPAAGNRRCFRATAVTLGAFYLLVLAGVFIRYILVTLEKDQLQTRYEMLQTRYDQLSSNYSQIQRKVSGKWCPEGWKRSGCSCYFKSEEKNYWTGSRDNCQKRGADLVVINNEEEHKFVTELSKDGEYWIGLWEERRNGEWEWVDGSPLTETFWASGLPHDDGYKNAATCCDQQGNWTQRRYYDETKKWICEN